MNNLLKPLYLSFFIVFFACSNTPSDIATINSTIYTVSAEGTTNETISNIPDRTSKTTFLAGLTKGEENQTWDTVSVSDPVENGDLIFVLAADETNEVTYTILVTEYLIGDTGPAGGKIFYIDDSLSKGWKYLEGAPTDQHAGYSWSNVNNITLASTSTAIGLGQTNTTAIINQVGHSISAALLCDQLTINEKDDWFLPSRLELVELYAQKNFYTSNGLSTGLYWSSSENNATTADGVDFSNGTSGDSNKTDTLYVRCIRSF